MGTPRVLVSWSGGKDSALALRELKRQGTHEVVALLTTVSEEYDRISMHGVRRTLLLLQARSLGYQLETVMIRRNASNEEYEEQIRSVLEAYSHRGVGAVMFGDIFLEDLRRYREDNLARIGMEGVFPLWERDTAELSRTFGQLGFRAVITCVDTEALGPEFSGREYDDQFVADLPPAVDPCGENGEFHTFVYDGPIFRRRIGHTVGERVLRDNRFSFSDVIPLLDEEG